MTPRNDLKRGQPSSPGALKDVTDLKKPRRSERVRGREEKATVSPVTPEVEAVASPVDTTMSPPARPVIHQAPPKATEAMSPPPPQSIPDTQESTQVASQILAYIAEEEYDPTVWGYLYPITDPTAKCIRLDKTPESPQEEVQEKGTKKKGKTGKASKATATEKKKSPHGFLIGRHPECDEQIDAAVISNRHCVIYRELVGGKPKAILEDLSSNGTWVNKIIIGRNRRRELEDGDEVEFAGGHTYHFKYPTKIKVNGFHDDYQKGSSIGNGHFATVYRAIEKKTGDLYAVKIFKRKKTAESTASFETEVSHLMTISHPNLIAMKAHYVEDDGVYLILEFLAGGELFNHIIKNQRLSESETRKIMKQLLSGLKYLHDRKIAHRDIKPENILIADADLTVKLADFGLAKIIGEASFTTTLCGTPSYVAPEILKGTDRRYNQAVDIWALGVVLYICLCGFPPFSDELHSAEYPYSLSQQIQQGLYDFPSPYWDSVGDSALSLIEGMLCVDPIKRLTVDQVLEHPWISEKSFDPAESCASLTNAIDNLGLKKRRAQRERTMLAVEPGTINPKAANPSKAKVRITQNENGEFIEEASQEEGGRGMPQEAQVSAFVKMGGKGGDEVLFDSFGTDNGSMEAQDGSMVMVNGKDAVDVGGVN